MIIKEIINRRSVRVFKPDSVEDEKITNIIKAAQFAPTGHNNRAVEYIVVKHQAAKDKIFEILDQSFLKKAPVIIIPVTDLDKAELSVQDLSIATENIMLQAVAEGLGSVWKNVEEPQANELKKLLGIPANFTMINVIPLGYPQTPPVAHQDKDFEPKKIHPEKW